MNTRTLTLALLSASLWLPLSAAAQSTDDHAHYGGPRAALYPHEHGDYLKFGRPGEDKYATSTVEIRASDDQRYSLPTLSVEQGQTIRFVFSNTGHQPHEFMLADPATQKTYEREHQTTPDLAATLPNATLVAPGESKVLVWRFDRSGVFELACHQPGMYQSGMVSYVSVPPAPKRGWR